MSLVENTKKNLEEQVSRQRTIDITNQIRRHDEHVQQFNKKYYNDFYYETLKKELLKRKLDGLIE